MSNRIVWVDIPVIDLDRAIGFFRRSWAHLSEGNRIALHAPA
jgi:hypothetical protein